MTKSPESNDHFQEKFQILSLSGGGVKGLYTAEVLAKLEKYSNIQITDHFDLICGTSIGGIIALALAYGLSPSDITNHLTQKSPEIFQKRNFLCAGLRQAFGSKHNPEPLKKLLETIFGDARIKDLKIPVLIPTVNASTGRPRIFKNRYIAEYTADQNIRLVDIALATSAAPTYFPMHEIDGTKYVDGGLVANSPILLGTHEATAKLGLATKDVFGLSVGTMSSHYTVNHRKANSRGYLNGWGMGIGLFELTLSANEQMHSFMARHVLSDNNVLIVDRQPTRAQADELDLDNASASALSILTANADQSARDLANNPLLFNMLQHQANHNILIK